jgi:hypothetical protein
MEVIHHFLLVVYRTGRHFHILETRILLYFPIINYLFCVLLQLAHTKTVIWSSDSFSPADISALNFNVLSGADRLCGLVVLATDPEVPSTTRCSEK